MVNQRQFGVEIELGTPYSKNQYQQTKALLVKHGFDNWAANVYHDGTELEIPSPILKGAAGMNELRRVMNLLNSKGFYTTEEDGMHVHHDTSDLNFKQIRRVALSWYMNQGLINTLVAEHRRNNHWCKNLTLDDLAKMEREARENKHLTNSWDDPAHDKYKSLSLYNRPRSGTLEIRLHEGTLDFEKAKAWILFGQAFITNTARLSRPLKCANVKELLDAAKVYKVAQPTLLKKGV